MKTSIISFKDISKYSRMDANFFIYLEEFKEAVKDLKKKHNIKEVREMLDNIKVSDRKILFNISRGQGQNAENTYKDYPYLSLAMIRTELAKKIDKLKSKISEEQEYLKTLSEIEKA